jgi:hypothetical protein
VLRLVRGTVMAVIAALMVASLPTGARADPLTCGPSARDACPLSGNRTLTGATPPPTFANSYYRFFARPGTQIVATITDTENPECSTLPPPAGGCGGVSISVLSANLSQLSGPFIQSSPTGGVTESATLRITLDAEGVYYFEITNLNALNRVTPFTLEMFASPAVTWPHPCVVPRIGHDEHLAIARYLLPRASCRAGRVYLTRDAHVPRGDVIRFSARHGRILAPQAKLGIYVSAG